MANRTIDINKIFLSKEIDLKIIDVPGIDEKSKNNNLELGSDAEVILQELSQKLGVSPQAVIEQSLNVVAQVREEKSKGKRIGIVNDQNKLSAEIVTGENRIVADLVRRLKPDEHDEERASRLKTADRAAFFEEVKNLILFFVMILSVCSVGSALAYVVFFKDNVPQETQRWAQTTLAALISGAFSFLLGKKVGGK